MLKIALSEHMARQILMVQALHNDDAARVAGHAACADRLIPPAQHGLPFGWALCLLNVVRIVADDAIGMFAAAVSSDRRRQAVAAVIVGIVGFLVLVAGKAKGPLAQGPIPRPAE